MIIVASSKENEQTKPTQTNSNNKSNRKKRNFLDQIARQLNKQISYCKSKFSIWWEGTLSSSVYYILRQLPECALGNTKVCNIRHTIKQYNCVNTISGTRGVLEYTMQKLHPNGVIMCFFKMKKTPHFNCELYLN